VELNQGRAGVVAVINIRHWPRWLVALVYALFGMSLPLMAAILPEDRADVLYHSYEGDNVTVDGPSILLRKQVGKHSSVYANYYTDSVSSASIDVRTTASPYTEERKEKSLGVDLLFDNTSMALGYTNSEENDYSSNSYHFGVSHSMFSELTTVSLGHSYGSDAVRKNKYDAFGNFVGNDPDFGEESLERRNYRLSLSQILTKNLIMSASFEAVTDEGFLRNPYRNARIIDPALENPGAINENYPKTRTSDSFALRANYYLPYRAAIRTEWKYFEDTWGIEAHTYKIEYTQPIKNDWFVDVRYRLYTQTAAIFYKDIFDANEEALTYKARDKELGTFNSQSFGFGVSYDFMKNGWWHFDKGTLSFSYDRMDFKYDDFTDLDRGSNGSSNPNFGQPFQFSADVIQLYISVWY